MGTHYQGTPEEIRAVNAYVKLQRAADSVIARATKHFAESGLTTSQYGVLDMLFHLGPLAQKQIAEKLVKSDGNVTTVVDNLNKRGLVERERGAGDRRVVTVSLTSEGRALIAQVIPIHVRIIVEEMSYLTADEQEILGYLCRRLGKREAPPIAQEDALPCLNEYRDKTGEEIQAG
jgi:MarR family 2-MHQ and catechol resistance regulon transcriptional repressor